LFVFIQHPPFTIHVLISLVSQIASPSETSRSNGAELESWSLSTMLTKPA